METPPEIVVLLRNLDEAYNSPAWHGPNLKGSIHRVPFQEALWQPSPGVKGIWEYTAHAAYWKYVVWRRLTGEKRGSFPRKGSNFFPLPPDDTSEKEFARLWKADVALLDEMHIKLREAVAALTPERLPPVLGLVTGAAAHDVYHAGQIQLLRQLYKRSKAEMTGTVE
jgi:hypothetical protein